MSASLLRHCGLVELVAEDQDEFVQKAVQLISSSERLVEYRDGLRSRLLKSDVCNGESFTAGLEGALQTMCAEQADR